MWLWVCRFDFNFWRAMAQCRRKGLENNELIPLSRLLFSVWKLSFDVLSWQIACLLFWVIESGLVENYIQG